MRIVALIEDGLGRLHHITSRSPDLVRRELSAQTGSAMLIWCTAPPEHHGAGSIVTQPLTRLVALGRILQVLFTVCVTEPHRAARRRKLRDLGRQIGSTDPLTHGPTARGPADPRTRGKLAA